MLLTVSLHCVQVVKFEVMLRFLYVECNYRFTQPLILLLKLIMATYILPVIITSVCVSNIIIVFVSLILLLVGNMASDKLIFVFRQTSGQSFAVTWAI